MFATTACGGQVQMVGAPISAETAAGERVLRATERGLRAASETTEFETLIRFNAAPCECPQWEVRLGRHWERVEVRPARDAEPEVQVVLSAPRTGARQARIGLTRDTVASAIGWRYAVIEVIAFRDAADP